MKLTNELLNKVALDFVKEKAENDYSIKSIALFGSLLKEDAIIQNSADIDLFVLESYGAYRREIVELTEDIHLDIEYAPLEDFQQTVGLRKMPYKGYLIYGCKPLYDPEHVLDFVQAGVRGNFFAPENVFARVNTLLGGVRDQWLKYQMTKHVREEEFAKFFIGLIHDTLQSIVLFEEQPLGTRRMLVDFPTFAKKAGDASLFADVLKLLGVAGMSVEDLRAWIEDWSFDFDSIQDLPKVEANIAAAKKNYYLRAIEEQLDSDVPFAAAWPLLVTWVDVYTYGEMRARKDFKWEATAKKLGFVEDNFANKMKEFDVFLDKVEEIFSNWKNENGL